MQQPPFISAQQRIPEITLKVIILSIFLTIILAASNAFLALKAGILTSASIPAAIISMGVLRLFNRANILENNLVQTCASTGEAVAGGIVYTIPALVIIHYWQSFPYWQCVLISFLGGILGVMVSVPLRRSLLNDPNLRFPEGRAIAEVLMATNQSSQGLRELIIGGSIGALFDFAQSGIKIFASNVQAWFASNGILYGFGLGLSPTLIGAGYLIGFDLGMSLLFGAIIGWLICIPVLTLFYPQTVIHHDVLRAVMKLWSTKVCYIGIGAMLVAGIWTLFSLIVSLLKNMRQALPQTTSQNQVNLRTDHDFSMKQVTLITLALVIVSSVLFWHTFPSFDFHGLEYLGFISFAVSYFIVMGFIVCAICGYFSGMVGVSASPGSSAILAAMLFIALIIREWLSLHHGNSLNGTHRLLGAAVTIIVGAMITGAAAITNDNMQDLKVGQIVGATPWKQQLMLMFGVLIGSLVIPPIMQLLFNVYGIGGVFPHTGMDPTQTLPAPPAAMMAALTQAVFKQNMPWNMMLIGATIGMVIILVSLRLKKSGKSLSAIGVATGIYLPLGSSIPLFLGSLIAKLAKHKLAKLQTSEQQRRLQKGLLLSCGLVAGSALMKVALTIPFALSGSPDYLRLLGTNWQSLINCLGLGSTGLLLYVIYRTATR